MRVVIDDAGDIPADLVKKHNIVIVPVNIHFGTEEFLSGVEMDLPAFYRKVETVSSSNFPKTSQPNPYQFEVAFRDIMAGGENEILVITVSEKLSKTYASAIAAGKEVEDQAIVHVFDSMSGSIGQGFMALEAARMAETGASYADILKRLEYMREKQAVAFLIHSLEFAVKGGRVSALRSTMASLLNIKPVMQLKEGEIVEAGKVRTHKKAMQFMVDFIKEKVGNQPVKLAYIHANTLEGARELQQLAGPNFNTTEELTVDLCVAVAINLGPGTLGLVAIPE